MEINIRKAILNNIENNSLEELEGTIVDAIGAGEEKMLPGLGFLFELIWNQSDEAAKNKMLETLDKGVKVAIN